MSFLTSQVIDDAALQKAVHGKTKGAVVTFAGIVRADEENDGTVTALTYEAYDAMAETEAARIFEELKKRWPDVAVAARHRTGRVDVGEAAVFIAVASPHRPEAFEACRFAIDEIKKRIPLWKKRVTAAGEGPWETCDHHHEEVTPRLAPKGD